MFEEGSGSFWASDSSSSSLSSVQSSNVNRSSSRSDSTSHKIPVLILPGASLAVLLISVVLHIGILHRIMSLHNQQLVSLKCLCRIILANCLW